MVVGDDDKSQELELLLDGLRDEKDPIESIRDILIGAEDEDMERKYFNSWQSALLAADSCDRLPYLNALHETLQNVTSEAQYRSTLFDHDNIEETISTVCIYPGSRDKVLTLIGIWEKFDFFPTEAIKSFRACTGEEDDSEDESAEDAAIQQRRPSLIPSAMQQSLSRRTSLYTPTESSASNTGYTPKNASVKEEVYPLAFHLRAFERNEERIKFIESKLNENGVGDYLKQYANLIKNEEILAEAMNAMDSSLKEFKEKVVRAIAGNTLLQECYKKRPILRRNILKSVKLTVEDEYEAEETAMIEMFTVCDEMQVGISHLQSFRSKHGREWDIRAQVLRNKFRKQKEVQAKRREEIREAQKAQVEKEKIARAEKNDRAKSRAAAEKEAEAQARAEEEKKAMAETYRNPLTGLVEVCQSNHIDDEPWRYK